MKTNKAFSLIEVLVVISISAFLIAILLPVLGSVKRSAENSIDITNIKNMAQGTITLAIDYDGYLPDADNDGGGNTNSGSMSWMLRSVRDMLIDDYSVPDEGFYCVAYEGSDFGINEPVSTAPQFWELGWNYYGTRSGWDDNSKQGSKVVQHPSGDPYSFIETLDQVDSTSKTLYTCSHFNAHELSASYSSVMPHYEGNDLRWFPQSEAFENPDFLNIALIDGSADSYSYDDLGMIRRKNAKSIAYYLIDD